MLISVSSVYSAAEKYQKSRRSREGYHKDHIATAADGAATAFSTFTLLIATLFFFLELILLFLRDRYRNHLFSARCRTHS